MQTTSPTALTPYHHAKYYAHDLTHLHSFFVSGTASHMMRAMWGLEKSQMKDRNIVFQEEDRETYIEQILSKAIRQH